MAKRFDVEVSCDRCGASYQEVLTAGELREFTRHPDPQLTIRELIRITTGRRAPTVGVLGLSWCKYCRGSGPYPGDEPSPSARVYDE